MLSFRFDFNLILCALWSGCHERIEVEPHCSGSYAASERRVNRRANPRIPIWDASTRHCVTRRQISGHRGLA